MLKTIRQLNTKLYIAFIVVCAISIFVQMFSVNTVKASAQESLKYQPSKIEVETVEVQDIHRMAEPTTIEYTTELLPREIYEEVTTVNPSDILSNVEDTVMEHVNYIAENYEPESPLTDEELDLLARVIHAESGNQDEKGKRLVADTVLNRMAYNNADIHSIIYADGQFSTAPILYNADNTPTEEELQIAFEESISQIDYEVYYFRTGHYHACGHPAFQWGAHYFSNV